MNTEDIFYGLPKRHPPFFTPIIGLPQDGVVGQPRGIRLRKLHVGWDFDIHNDPLGGKFDPTTREDLGMSEE